MEPTVQCPSCGAENLVSAFRAVEHERLTLPQRLRRAHENRILHPFFGRPMGVSWYDALVTVGVALLLATLAKSNQMISVNGVFLIPIVYYTWRSNDVSLLSIEIRQRLPRARSTALVLLEWAVFAVSVLSLFTLNRPSGHSFLMAMYVGWAVIIVQYLRFRHRVIVRHPGVSLRWWQRSDYMACFILLLILALAAIDADYTLSNFYDNRYIEALLQ